MSILPTQPTPVSGPENYVIGVIHMIFQAPLSNKVHPKYGVKLSPSQSPPPVRHTVELLEAMGIGTPTAQDCRVDEVSSEYPILNRLVTQSTNVDELDYLAKQPESFCKGEGIQFQAMVPALNPSDIRDFINCHIGIPILTGCWSNL